MSDSEFRSSSAASALGALPRGTPEPNLDEIQRRALRAIDQLHAAVHHGASDTYLFIANDIQAVIAHLGALRRALNEYTSVCACGCPLSEHDVYEEGESCEHDNHHCNRVSKAVYTELAELRAALDQARGDYDYARGELASITDLVGNRSEAGTYQQVEGKIAELQAALDAERTTQQALIEQWREQDQALQDLYDLCGTDATVTCPNDVVELVSAALHARRGPQETDPT